GSSPMRWKRSTCSTLKPRRAKRCRRRIGDTWRRAWTATALYRPTAMRSPVKRAERAGCPVVAVTLDLPNGRNTETQARFQKLDTRVCENCHGTDGRPNADPTGGSTKPMFAGIDMDGIAVTSPSLTWDFIRRLKDVTTMKVVLKGLQTREDAALAVKNGADGIIVSNHGGRSAETLRGTIDCLPEVVQGTGGRIPVIVDSGFRR